MSAAAAAREGRSQPDPRTVRSRERVVDAAWCLLREGGAAACTIEAVAAASGVAKTTIYRQFRDSEELIHAVIEELKPEPVVPDTGDVLADVSATLIALARDLFDGDGSRVVPVMIDLAERSERAHDLATEFGARRRSILAARLEVAARRGELAGPVDVDLLIAQLVGPLFYRRYVSRQPTSARFVTRLAGATLRPLLAPPAGGDGGGGAPPR